MNTSWFTTTHNIFCVSLQLVCSYCTMAALVFLAFYLSLQRMLIHKVSICNIIDIHQMVRIIRWIICKGIHSQANKKSLLINRLNSSKWNTFCLRVCFCKYTLKLTRKWSDSMENTDTTLIKLSSSREVTSSKMWSCMCVLSLIWCLWLADQRMSASCLVSAFLWQSQCILKSPKIKRWPILVASKSTNPENSLKKSASFILFFLVVCNR